MKNSICEMAITGIPVIQLLDSFNEKENSIDMILKGPSLEQVLKALEKENDKEEAQKRWLEEHTQNNIITLKFDDDERIIEILDHMIELLRQILTTKKARFDKMEK